MSTETGLSNALRAGFDMPRYAAMHERWRWRALAVVLEGSGADLRGAAGPVSRL